MENLGNLQIECNDAATKGEWTQACLQLDQVFGFASQAPIGGAIGGILEQLTQDISCLAEDQDNAIPELDISSSISKVTACLVCTSAHKIGDIRNLNTMQSRMDSAGRHGYADAETNRNILKETKEFLSSLATDLGKQRPDGLAINVSWVWLGASGCNAVRITLQA